MQNNRELYRNGFANNMEASSRDLRSAKKMKRFRSAFTTEQVNYLEREFNKFPYIGTVHRTEVATALNLPERAVKIWFQNRRMKEKKDTTGKDIDEELIDLNAIEISKNPLNNVPTTLSTNDRQVHSLPLLISPVNNESKVNENKKSCPNDIFTLPARANYYNESTYVQNQSTALKIQEPPPVVKDRESPVNYKVTGDFSIGLCKQYRRDSNSSIKFEDKDLRIKKKDEPNISNPINFNDYRNVSEDLNSYKRFEMSPPQHEPVRNNIPNSNRDNTGHKPVLPNFYQQSYVQPGGVLWNPVNVMPIMSAGASAVTISNGHNGLSIVQEQNISKVNCTCDCHVKTYPVPIAFQQNHSGPQYIITAVPFQNLSSKF